MAERIEIVLLVISGNTLIQQGIGNRLDHIAVKVCAAQAFGNECAGIYHYNIIQMRKVFVTEIANLLNGRYYSFFVTRYMGIS